MTQTTDIMKITAPRMDPAVKAQWLTALRSGEYKQTGGTLKGRTLDDDGYATGPVGFCCLGVLCDVVAPDGFDEYLPDRFRYLYGDEIETAGLPEGMSDRINMDSMGNIGTIQDQDGDYRAVALYRLNDTDLFTFSQIADVVEYFL